MVSIVVSYQAEADLDNAGKWYDKKLRGLSIRLFDEIDEYLNKIQNNPFSFSVRKEGSDTRRCGLKKFPYNIYFTVENERVFVIAILHKSRSSRFVKKRLK